MNHEELTKTFMMLLNFKKTLGPHDLYRQYFSAVKGLNMSHKLVSQVGLIVA